MDYTNETVMQQREYHTNKVESFYKLLDESELSPRAKIITTAIMQNRGNHRNVELLIASCKAIDISGNRTILDSIWKDTKSSSREKNEQSRWSGVGKENGIEKLAVLAKYATDEQIESFFRLRAETETINKKTKNRYSMPQVDEIMLHEYNFDTKQTLIKEK